MNRIVGVLILGGCLVAVAVVGVNYHNAKMAELQLEAGRSRLRAAYVERAGVINAASNAERHHEELYSLVKWYDAQLADLYNAFPGLHDADGAMKEMQAQLAAGKLKPEEMATKKEWYDETKGLYDAITHGRYTPLVTAVQEGVRIDILSIKRATYEGKNRLRMDVVLWGAPRREVTTAIKQGQGTRTKMELDFALKGLEFEFVDEKEKLLGGGATGAPTMVVDYPERWVSDFPPQVALGIWYFDPFPAETKTISMKMTADVKSPTSPAFGVTQEWKLVPQPEWLIRPGEKFEGEERVMSKEELDRSGRAQK